MKKSKQTIYRRILSVTMALVVAATFMPLLGDSSYAEDNSQPGEISSQTIDISDNDIEVEAYTTQLPSDYESLVTGGEEPAGEPAKAPEEKDDADAITNEGTENTGDGTDNSSDKEMDTPDAVSTDSADQGISMQLLDNNLNTEALVDASQYCTVNVVPNYSNSTVSISASAKNNYRISMWGIYQGNIVKSSATVNNTSFSATVNMRNYETGYYGILIFVQKYSSKKWTDFGYVDKPNISFDYVSITPDTSGSYESYSTYFNYQKWDPRYIQGYRLYIEYWAPGGAVTTQYMDNYYTTYQFGGLTPNTTYNIRFRYGRVKNGVVMYGPYSAVTAIKTGMASTNIKSIKVKATKIRKRRKGVYGWYTGYYFGSVKYYTYKLKVTVTLKKKPGTPGIYINGIYRPGNKKKYKLTLGTYAAYKKPKGKKFTVMVYSSQGPGSYGGYSPLYTKSKKIK